MLSLLKPRRDQARESFDQEILPHLPVLYGNALRLTRSSADAEDLVQETVLRAFRFYERFERGSNLKAWLLRIQYNLFVNRYRRRAKEREIRDAMPHEPSGRDVVSRGALRALTDPDGTLSEPLVREELQRALDALPEDYRTVIVLADIEELSYREIADVVGCPIGTVMSRLHRARRAMRAHLEAAEALGTMEPAEEEASPEASGPVSLERFRRGRRSS